MDSSPQLSTKQASHKEKATTEWNVDDLLGWIDEKRPHMLEDDDRENLRLARISGEVFLTFAGNIEFFENKCKLPVGIAVVLANLSRELAKVDSKLLSFMSCTPRRHQTNSVTGNRQQAEDVEMTDAADKVVLPVRMTADLAYPPQTYPPLSYCPQQYHPQQVYPQQQPPYGAAPQPSYPPQGLPPAQYAPSQQQYGPLDPVTTIARVGTAGIKSKFTIFIHAHYVDCKLTTSQETYSRPEMWRCPTPPPKSHV